MFGLDMLDVAIGVVVVYLLLSLVASAIAELIESFLKKRAKDLAKGIRELLQEPPVTEKAKNTDKPQNRLVDQFYRHPLINALYAGAYDSDKPHGLPSYIPARSFAIALLDILENPDGAVVGTNKSAKEVLKDFPGGEKLLRIVNKLTEDAGTDIEKKRKAIEEWFNASMDRVSGWYKRRTHWIMISIGALMAVVLNVDTIYVVKRFNSDKALREVFVARAETLIKEPPIEVTPQAANAGTTTATDSQQSTDAAQIATTSTQATETVQPTPQVKVKTQAPTSRETSSTTERSTAGSAPPTTSDPRSVIDKNIAELEKLGLPLGWDRLSTDERKLETWADIREWLFRILGWLLTALAISLGAPFWFDTLNKIMVIRSTVKPTEKSKDEASEDRQLKLKITAG